LCKGVPDEFAIYLKYVRELKFEEKPSITYLRKLIMGLFKREGYEMDYEYDWIVKKKHQ
jgi:hypothetical protein